MRAFLFLLSLASFAIGAEPSLQHSLPLPTPERYYLTLYGAESSPFRIRHTHTFATFTRTAVTPSGEIPLSTDTISWMPATLNIRAFALRPETGVNLSLNETFEWISSFNGHASMWGPYEIDPDRYARFLARKADLDSGAFQYRAIGAFTRGGDVSNCGQSFARSSPIVGRKYFQPTPSPGENGTSQLAARYLRVGALQNNGATYPWLIPAIGADQYSLVARHPGERIPRFRR